MRYPYRCACGKEFEVIKHSKNIDDIEICPECGHNCTKENRYIGRTHFYGADDWDKASYNPAFGKVILNKKHAAAEAKARGMIEIGNEDLNKYNAELDKDNQKKRQARWDKV